MIALAFACFALALFISYALVKGGLSGVARGRKYKSGTGWCVWRWTDVESEYILRLHIVKTPLFAICLHWIRKPDLEPWLHDHPVSFLSIVLRGRYAELRARGDGDIGVQLVERWNYIRATPRDRHRIVFCRANTLTLCFMGPKRREWGFHMPTGWVGWKDYYARLKAGEDMRIETPGMWARAGGFIPLFERFVRDNNDILDQLTRAAELHGVPVTSELRPIDGRPADPYNPDDYEHAEPER